jgi:hypothetical protein
MGVKRIESTVLFRKPEGTTPLGTPLDVNGRIILK